MVGLGYLYIYYFVSQLFLSLERYRHQMLVLLTGGNFSFQLMLGLSLDFTDNEHCRAQLYLFSEKIQLINLSVHYLWKS